VKGETKASKNWPQILQAGRSKKNTTRQPRPAYQIGAMELPRRTVTSAAPTATHRCPQRHVPPNSTNKLDQTHITSKSQQHPKPKVLLPLHLFTPKKYQMFTGLTAIPGRTDAILFPLIL